jgi:hypothetical protein
MDSNGSGGRVTSTATDGTTQRAAPSSSTGDVDRDGEVVGELAIDLCDRIGTAVDFGPYIEKPGLDDRIAAAGADIASVRCMLGVPR